MFRILTLAALGAAAALAAQAHPAPAGPGASETQVMMIHGGMAALDKDGDGYVSREEFLAHPAAMFDHLDADHDGRLSKQELAAMPGSHRVCKMQGPGDAQPREVPCDGVAGAHGGADPEMMAMMMHHMAAMLDADHDGRVSWEEFETGLRAHFQAMDKNKDGYLTSDEMPGAGAMIVERHVEKHD